ncbi:MAG: cobalamin-binding protein [Alphaproteobacteria bacterium]|nr:cobalamin-binding protein [Alphaproteobacteria bacterium]MBU1516134.1 cobalamin-binding protein [Alphaproteobacteria bacterium]MBU2092651.1 cobalamin-binding protein [Alphaproteobacteria bacterium]MBU2152550.1 cobalamin-binding protein [Alphaproteobacteria bacterium]MBU2308452.1 cobalamin-binding protein [Alphaproteobacteria bacterium]
MSALRIVSLLPSATEIVAAVGMADQLVGRSHQCDFPVDVRHLPALSETKVNLDGTSRDIDRRVNEIIAQGVSVYRVDAELLRALKPDVIITQTQCAICAVTPGDLEDALCEWTGMAPILVSLEPNDLADVWGDMRKVGRALGAEGPAHAAIVGLQARLMAIRETANRAARYPTVAAIEWIDPLMAGGNWMPELIEAAGGQSLFATAGQHSPWLDWSALAAADPEVILLLPCGFTIAQSLADIPLLAGRPEWAALTAVREGRVFVIDGHHYFNRPGPRLVESAEMIAEILHPDLFAFGHEGTGWVRLP